MVCRARRLVGAHVKGVVGVGRNVRAVAIALRTACAPGSRGRLPRWDGILMRRNAAAAIGPRGLRGPGPAGRTCVEVGSTDGGHVHIVCWVSLGSLARRR